jgi:hypothetical protein
MSTVPATVKPKGYNSDYNFFQRKTLKGVTIEFPHLKVALFHLFILYRNQKYLFNLMMIAG